MSCSCVRVSAYRYTVLSVLGTQSVRIAGRRYGVMTQHLTLNITAIRWLPSVAFEINNA